MAGTIRKRTWVTRKGETKTAWLADYFDQKRNRHTKQFRTKKAADTWLLRARGEVRDGIHTPDSVSLNHRPGGRAVAPPLRDGRAGAGDAAAVSHLSATPCRADARQDAAGPTDAA